jgi:cytochrome c peroxidase
MGFSDNAAFSRGFENKMTTRNSIPIQNLASFSFEPDAVSLFWDGRQSFLSSMVLKPITNHVEMGMNDDNAIAERVRNVPYYADLFSNAFNGETDVTATKIANALAAFTGSINTTHSKFDQVLAGQGSLSALETQGQNLFVTKYNCISCHQSVVAPIGYGSASNPAGFVNIGLDENYSDKGLGALTGSATDDGKFKVPSLRNVALTAPYMHDGRFATLNEVLDHYSHGIANSSNLDERLKGSDHLPLQMNISDQEKSAMVAFLGTLTDYSMTHDVRFSSPFISE